MSEIFTSYIVQNDKDFQAAIDRLAKSTDDFRIPFGLISREFYKTNKKIFQLKSKGLYPPLGGFNYNRLTPSGKTRQKEAEEQKQSEVGFIYPLLVRTGALASSMTNPSDPKAIKLIGKQYLELGTAVEYGVYHQSDRPRSKIPQRKFLFIDGGPLERSIGASTSGRRETWLNIINQYILDEIKRFEKESVI